MDFPPSPITLSNAIKAVKDAALHYQCDWREIIWRLHKYHKVELPSGALLVLVKEHYSQSCIKYIGLISLYGMDPIDCAPYNKESSGEYTVYIDGMPIKSFPRLFLASDLIDSLTKILSAPRSIYCTDNHSNIYSFWQNIGSGRWRGKDHKVK